MRGVGGDAAGRADQPAGRAGPARHDRTLGRITCPTLVCGGRYDGIAPQANSEFLARMIPGARLALFDGGHGFFVQDDSAWPAILAFLGEGAADPADP